MGTRFGHLEHHYPIFLPAQKIFRLKFYDIEELYKKIFDVNKIVLKMLFYSHVHM